MAVIYHMVISLPHGPWRFFSVLSLNPVFNKRAQMKIKRRGLIKGVVIIYFNYRCIKHLAVL